MRIRLLLAGLALAIPFLATGCTGCGHCGARPAISSAPPVIPAPSPCCGGGPVAAPVTAQPSYSIPVYPSNGYR
jgi:hypothetical protein